MKKILAALAVAAVLVAGGASQAHVNTSAMSTQYTRYDPDTNLDTIELVAKGTFSADSHPQTILDIDVQKRDSDSSVWRDLYPHGHKVIDPAGASVSVTLNVGIICNSYPLEMVDYLRIKFRARTFNASGTKTGDETIYQSQRRTCDVAGPYQ